MFDVFAYQGSMAPPLMQAAYVWSLAFLWPQANLVLAILIMTGFEVFHCIYYSGVISTMPRTGGEYVWISRLLNAPLAFGIIFAGWIVTLPMWITLIVINVTQQTIAPLFLLLGNVSAAKWLLSYDGLFTVTLINIAYGFVTCGFGLKWYGRIQKIIFPIAIIGTFIAIFVFAVGSHATLVQNFNNFYHDVLGYPTTTAFQDTTSAASAGGLVTDWNWNVGQALPVIPVMAWYGLWGVWGAPLYGEVRGATSMKKTLYSTLGSGISVNLLGVAFLVPLLALVGYNWYTSANWLWWMGDTAHAPIPPSPGLWIYFLTGSIPLTLFILFFNGWTALHFNGGGNGYLAVSRMMFAMSFDRMLPSSFASLKTRSRIPLISMIWTAVFAAVYGWLYCYNIPILGVFGVSFRDVFLDATLVLLIGFVAVAVIAIVLPYKRPELWEASAASKWQILIQASAFIYLGFLGMLFYYYIVDPAYGTNSITSAVFLGSVYIAAVIVYFSFKYYRKRQGIDITKVYRELPVE